MTTMETLVMAFGAMGLGIILLVKGGNWTVDAAIFLAKHMGVSRLVIGLTVVAFGTSLPELVISVNSNYQNLPGIALGNVIGSNTANILLVIGATALIGTLSVIPRLVIRDLSMMLVATLILAGLMKYGTIGHLAGLLMIIILLLYTFWIYRKASVSGIETGEESEEPFFKNLKISVLFLILGLLGITAGAEFLVRGAKISAAIIGVPDAVIGLSIIAIGTSLPELSTCLVAAGKKQTDIVIGNIVGSNIFNILMIIGMTALLKPIQTGLAAAQLSELDIWITLAVSLIFAAILFFYGKINRFIGIIFLGAYTVYMVSIFAFYIT